jgi:hypothetical protein
MAVNKMPEGYATAVEMVEHSWKTNTSTGLNIRMYVFPDGRGFIRVCDLDGFKQDGIWWFANSEGAAIVFNQVWNLMRGEGEENDG